MALRELFHDQPPQAQYIYVHKAALVGHVVAGTTIQAKDMRARLACLDSDLRGAGSARSYTQEFQVSLSTCLHISLAFQTPRIRP